MHEIIVNLHMHTRYSDGSGSHQDIAEAALKCGLDAVIVTDHNVLVRGFEGYFKDGNKKVLMLIGEEIHDQDREPQKNHLLVFGAEKELATFAHDPQMLISAVRELGGLSFHCPSQRSGCARLRRDGYFMGGLVAHEFHRHRALEWVERAEDPGSHQIPRRILRLFSRIHCASSNPRHAAQMG